MSKKCKKPQHLLMKAQIEDIILLNGEFKIKIGFKIAKESKFLKASKPLENSGFGILNLHHYTSFKNEGFLFELRNFPQNVACQNCHNF